MARVRVRVKVRVRVREGAGAGAGKGEGEGEGDEEVQRVGRHHVSTPHSGPDARSDCTHTTVQQHERTMAGTF